MSNLKPTNLQHPVEKAEVANLGAERYSATRSKAKRLRQIAFVFDGNKIRPIRGDRK